ncbi:MAG: hypothetical protein K8T10_10940 [Candidatus Eremiobacteraeota bacterium]|nr:hypothetical protein [Candidatus Eremiobacteraeota bacterium]
METFTYVFLFFAVILLAIQIYIITGLMRLHEIATNIDRVVALVAAIASKMGVTSNDVQKAWGIKGDRGPETPKEPEKKEPVKEEKEPTTEEEEPVKEEKKKKQGKKKK